jgi:hypothetical protein
MILFGFPVTIAKYAITPYTTNPFALILFYNIWGPAYYLLAIRAIRAFAKSKSKIASSSNVQ